MTDPNAPLPPAAPSPEDDAPAATPAGTNEATALAAPVLTVRPDAPLTNPPDGTLIEVAAGKSRNLHFTFHNETSEMSAFRLVIHGLAPEWVTVSHLRLGQVVPPGAGGALTLTLAPPVGANVREVVPFTVLVATDHGVTVTATPLRLQVTPLHPPTERLTQPLTLARADAPPTAENSAGNGVRNVAVPEEMRLVTLPPRLASEPLPVIAPAEIELLDLNDDSQFEMLPGESRLLAFSFTNYSALVHTYIISDDGSLPRGWLETQNEQINVSRDASDKLSVRIRLPADAAPGFYRFRIFVRRLDGGEPAAERRLTLAVASVPAVSVSTPHRWITIPPWRTVARFPLTIANIGNAGTAVRLVTHRPELAQSAARLSNGCDYEGQIPPAIVGTRFWRYDFDQELINVLSASSRAPAQALLRVRPTSRIWWTGFSETHQLRVAAYSVTAPENNGSNLNALTIGVKRWRPWPFPALTLFPLAALLFLLFSQRATEVHIKGELYRNIAANGSRNSFVAIPDNADDPKITAGWSAPALAFLGLQLTPIDAPFLKQQAVTVFGMEREHTFDLRTPNYQKNDQNDDSVRMGRLLCNVQLSQYFGLKNLNNNALIVFTRKSHYFEVRDVSDGKNLLDPAGELIPLLNEQQALSNGEKTTISTCTVVVPRDGIARIDLINRSAPNEAVLYWPVRRPMYLNGDDIEALYPELSGFLYPSAPRRLKYAYRKGPALPMARADADHNTLILLTTDQRHSLVKVRFVLGPPASPPGPTQTPAPTPTPTPTPPAKTPNVTQKATPRAAVAAPLPLAQRNPPAHKARPKARPNAGTPHRAKKRAAKPSHRRNAP